ncbi:MAG: Gldg family protein [Gemmataceae bacterium]
MTEEALTNGIIRVAKSANQVIYFLDGHGEADVSDNATDDGFGMLKKSLEGEGYTVKKLLLATEAKVPGDASEVIVAGPKKQLLPHEIDALNDYLKTGGRMLIMFRPPAPDQPIDESALAKLAADWGVKAGADVVVDQVVRLFAGPALGLTPMVDTYEGDSPITRGFKQRTVFPMVRSLTTAPDLKTGLAVIPIAKTSDTSWAETDLEGVFRHGQAKFSGNDLKGPIDVVDEVQGDLERMGMGKGEARLVMFGSTEFADNKYLNDFYNRDFFMNSADWLAGEANSISIRPRMIRASRFRLTVSDFEIVFALSVLLLPEMLSLLGIIVWWERRN